MQNFIFTANNVAPVFLIVAVGILLKQTHLINDIFVSISSKVVFTISLPALIFNELSKMDLSRTFNLNEIIFVYAATLISFFIVWFFTIPFIKEGKDRASFIQGAFRGNYAIVGLALVENLFGKSGLGKASILLAFVLPLYNVLAVIALTVPVRKERNLDGLKTFLEILKNPLIIAVIIALPFSIWKIPINNIVSRGIGYLADLALPLALIGIGGSLNFGQIKKASVMAFFASAYKIIFIPLVFTYFAFLLGYKGENLGIVFILFASPTAVASFVMAEAMGCNEKLAGNIILVTTMFSVITIAFGLFLLKSFSLI
jgi:malonate transporter and related proteins